MRTRAKLNEAWVSRAVECFISREDEDPALRADRQDRLKISQGKRWLKENGFPTGRLGPWPEWLPKPNSLT